MEITVSVLVQENLCALCVFVVMIAPPPVVGLNLTVFVDRRYSLNAAIDEL